MYRSSWYEEKIWPLGKNTEQEMEKLPEDFLTAGQYNIKF